MNDIVMTKLLEGQQITNDKLTQISERIVRVEETVKKHDETTFPSMQKELDKQSNALYRMESKQNADITYFTGEKEAVIERLKPLEDDLKKRQDAVKSTETEMKKIKWNMIEKGIYLLLGVIASQSKTIVLFIMQLFK